VEGIGRRQFLARGAAVAALAAAGAGGLVAATRDEPRRRPEPRRRLRKLVDIGPGGVIDPGSAQDLRAAGNLGYYADTDTGWIRMWADWPSLQPDPDLAPGDPRSPGARRLHALDEQIALARAHGLRVVLMPYRFPTWANGTAALSARKDSDEEIAFRREERMSEREWRRYERAGRDARVHSPRRRALEYLLPDDPYGPAGAWAGFFAFLYDRYGGRVDAFELVNEPNLQLWPQRGVPREIARLLATAQGISASHAHSTLMLAPSLSDDEAPSNRLYTRYDEFIPALLDELASIGYIPHSRQAWSHHNYTDVERRRTRTGTQRIRGLLAGRWAGYAEGAAPTVFITEGGARLSRMAALYPDEDARRAQAKCVRDAWALHLREDGAGAGVAMHAQYLLHADPNFDCGLLDPYPSTVKRPAYAAWKAFPASS
jgi:hypothetical protein